MDMMADNKNKEPYINMVRRVLDAHGERWYLNGERHREDGPAVVWADGSKFWYIDDKRHRLYGLAVEYANGRKWFFIAGVEYTEEDYTIKIKEIKYNRTIDKNC